METTFEQEVQALYDWVDEQVRVAAPRCEISGRCCRFREYGHRLYISRSEAEILKQAPLPEPITVADLTPSAIERQCPYQVNGLCTARQYRPLGCRIFFCDPDFEQQAAELTETALSRLKTIHDRHHRTWEYADLAHFVSGFSGDNS